MDVKGTVKNNEYKVDPRFPSWEPNEKTVKTTILYHMSYAHEDQAKKEGIEWWAGNVNYWLGKYTRKELLEIHQKYHEVPEEDL